MGKRKLRFSGKKNYEKKKYAKKSTTPVASSPSLSLDLNTLHQGLMQSSALPPGWSCTIVANSHIALSKLHLAPPSLSASTLYMLTIAPDLTWMLHVGLKQVSVEHCQPLRGVHDQLCSVDDICAFVRIVDGSHLCAGNPDTKFSTLNEHHKGKFMDRSGAHVVAYHDPGNFPQPTIRHSDCGMIVTNDCVRCQHCDQYRKTLHVLAGRLTTRNVTEISSHTNFRYLTSPEKISRMHNLQHQHKQDQKQLDRLREKLKTLAAKQGILLDESLTQDLHQLMVEEDATVKAAYPEDSFQHIFWQQQKEAASRPGRGMRWHPLMVKWCIYLRHQSSKAYETLRDSKCIHLPSQRTLRDYSNCVKAAPGFSQEVDCQLMQAAQMDSCEDWQKLVLLLLDEMHIKEGLVYDKISGNVIGYSDLGDINNHLLAFERSMKGDEDTGAPPAKSMMVMMVRGIFTTLRFPYVQFPVARITGDLLFQPFWEAVYRLERMGLKVLGATSDGAAVNRRLVKLHSSSSDEVVYKARNIHAPDERDLFFFSDPPHLIKTTRNCWSSKSRKLWNNGYRISWYHLVKLYEKDKSSGQGLSLAPKLKYEHVYSLTSFSKMRVDLAAQVLSETVANALSLTGGPSAQGTSKFASIFDKFFDALNVSNFTNGTRKQKRFQHPYRHAEDFRLAWLEDVFLAYLDKWEESVEALPDLTPSQKQRKLLSPATRLGLRMTAKSFVGLVKTLFTLPEVKGKKLAFLSVNISQDPLENYFGCQRQRGGTSDNPNAKQFMENSQALRVVNSFCRAPVRGNCRGSRTLDPVEDEFASAPITKRRRK